jgi:hypothetical protein
MASIVRDVEVMNDIPRELLAEEIARPERLKAFFAAIDRGLASDGKGTRAAINTMAWAYGIMKRDDVKVALIVQQFGLQSMDDLTRIVASGKRLEQLASSTAQSFETARDDALDILRLALREHPEWRGLVAHELGFASTNGAGR